MTPPPTFFFFLNLLLFLSNLIVLHWKQIPHSCVTYLPGRNGLSSVKLMEARWRAGRRGEEPLREREGQMRRGMEGGREKKRGGESTGPALGSHWRVRLRYPSPPHWHACTCKGPGGRACTLSCSMRTHHPCGHAPSCTDVQRKAHSDAGPETEEDGEGEGEGEGSA